MCSDVQPGITYLTSTSWDIKAPVERHPERVILALEPEAAALSCQTLSQKHTADYCKATPSELQSLRYLVVDIGGGTVDIAAHLVQKRKEDHFCCRYTSLIRKWVWRNLGLHPRFPNSISTPMRHIIGFDCNMLRNSCHVFCIHPRTDVCGIWKPHSSYYH